MILLTYCAGLRVGELAHLTLADVDLTNDVIEIRGTKFFKSRLLPLAPGVSAALTNYLAARRKIGGSIEPTSGLLWREPRGGAYSCGGIRNLITAALRRAGLKPVRGKVSPPIHALRHALGFNRMQPRYRDGIKPHV